MCVDEETSSVNVVGRGCRGGEGRAAGSPAVVAYRPSLLGVRPVSPLIHPFHYPIGRNIAYHDAASQRHPPSRVAVPVYVYHRAACFAWSARPAPLDLAVIDLPCARPYGSHRHAPSALWCLRRPFCRARRVVHVYVEPLTLKGQGPGLVNVRWVDAQMTLYFG